MDKKIAGAPSGVSLLLDAGPKRRGDLSVEMATTGEANGEVRMAKGRNAEGMGRGRGWWDLASRVSCPGLGPFPSAEVHQLRGP